MPAINLTTRQQRSRSANASANSAQSTGLYGASNQQAANSSQAATASSAVVLAPFNADVTSVILTGELAQATDKLPLATEYAIWRTQQAGELVLRLFVWCAVQGFAPPLKAKTIYEAEGILLDSAANYDPRTIDLADEYLERVRAYCLGVVDKCQAEAMAQAA